ncbi:hypothetical protein LTR95_006328 [Oleoguttula sp. CCFEE 5521]
MILERATEVATDMDPDVGNLASLTLDEQRGMPSVAFLALPEELRLLIYEQLYALLAAPGTTNLAPLSHAVLRTCRQVYIERLPTYRASLGPYYRNTHFTLQVGINWSTCFAEIGKAPTKYLDRNIPQHDFDKISHLPLIVHRDRGTGTGDITDYILTLIHPLGGWRVRSPQGQQALPKGPPEPRWPHRSGSRGQMVDGRLQTFRRFQPWVLNSAPWSKLPPIIDPKRAVWDYHASEEEVRRACEEHRDDDGGGLQKHLLALLERRSFLEIGGMEKNGSLVTICVGFGATSSIPQSHMVQSVATQPLGSRPDYMAL